MPMSTRLAVAAVIGVLAVAGAFYLIRPDQPSVGPPAPTPASASPVAWSAAAGMAEARTDFAVTLLPMAASSWSAGGAPAGHRPLPRSSIRPRGVVECRDHVSCPQLPDRDRPLKRQGARPWRHRSDHGRGGTVVDLYDPATNSWGTTGERRAARPARPCCLETAGSSSPAATTTAEPVSARRSSTIPPRAHGPPPGT